LNSDVRASSGTGLLLLNLAAWIRRQAWLQVLYRRLPRVLRDGVSRAMAGQAQQRARFARTPAWDRAIVDPPAPVASVAPEYASAAGVNLFGYFRGQFGLAESARMYARALLDSGYPVALHDIDIDLPHVLDDRSLQGQIGQDTPHPVSIVFVNPDYLPSAIEHIGEARMQGRYLIGCWFWELQEIPAAWLPAIDRVDEIMVASEFVEQAFRRVTHKPILRVPLPLNEVPDSGLQREDFGLRPDRFVFLCTFDFNSWVARKNPLATIDAFRRAFPSDRTDVQLLLKSSNGHRHLETFRALLNEVAGDSRIVVRDEVIDRAHVHALQRCADVYVSLHRSEGFGLGLAECMALGKPVIGTDWSGNRDFMNERNSCLVGYRLVPVGEGEYPHEPGAHWAEADVDQAARHMRRLADDRDFAATLGRQARIDAVNLLSPRLAAQRIAQRLQALGMQPKPIRDDASAFAPSNR
jgi:glycosyltransferase involved in cell wall biosynthesis